MLTRSRLLLLVVVIVALLSLSGAFYRTVVMGDFEITESEPALEEGGEALPDEPAAMPAADEAEEVVL